MIVLLCHSSLLFRLNLNLIRIYYSLYYVLVFIFITGSSQTCHVVHRTTTYSVRLSLFYKGLNGLESIPTNQLQNPSRTTRHTNINTFIPLSTRIDAYKHSFFPRAVVNWNSLTDEVRLQHSLLSFPSSILSCY